MTRAKATRRDEATTMHATMSRFVFATLLLALGTPPPATAVDLSGDYVGFAVVPFTVTEVQTGTGLQMIGHVVYNSATYPLSATGTVDPTTGAFSVSGEITGLCPDFVYSGTGDGEELTGTFTSPTCPSGRVLLTKCANGVIDPMENCEDGNYLDGDCCSARCRSTRPEPSARATGTTAPTTSAMRPAHAPMCCHGAAAGPRCRETLRAAWRRSARGLAGRHVGGAASPRGSGRSPTQ